MNSLKMEQKWSKSEPMFEHHRSNASGIEKNTCLYPAKMPHFFWIVSSPPKYCQNPGEILEGRRSTAARRCTRTLRKDPWHCWLCCVEVELHLSIIVSPKVRQKRWTISRDFFSVGFYCSIFVGNSYYYNRNLSMGVLWSVLWRSTADVILGLNGLNHQNNREITIKHASLKQQNRESTIKNCNLISKNETWWFKLEKIWIARVAFSRMS